MDTGMGKLFERKTESKTAGIKSLVRVVDELTGQISTL